MNSVLIVITRLIKNHFSIVVPSMFSFPSSFHFKNKKVGGFASHPRSPRTESKMRYGYLMIFLP